MSIITRLKTKFLVKLFRLINPPLDTNLLSVEYSMWNQARKKSRVENYKKYCDVPERFFTVPGAGEICISDSCHSRTGKVVGFSLSVDWCDNPFIGGVLGRDEAKRMAEFILEKCSEVTETMDEERTRINKEFSEYCKLMDEKNI